MSRADHGDCLEVPVGILDNEKELVLVLRFVVQDWTACVGVSPGPVHESPHSNRFGQIKSTGQVTKGLQCMHFME